MFTTVSWRILERVEQIAVSVRDDELNLWHVALKVPDRALYGGVRIDSRIVDIADTLVTSSPVKWYCCREAPDCWNGSQQDLSSSCIVEVLDEQISW